MRIFVFTTVFAPKIGGIERLTEVLAREWVEMGHDMVVATTTPGPTSGYPFRVIRSGSLATFVRWGRWCDVHVQMNVSLKYTLLGVIGTRHTVVVHHGVYDDHGQKRRVALKLRLARVLPGIAVSRFVADHVECRHAIPNAVDRAVFRNEASWHRREKAFAFLGRLVSDKGCDTLLLALAELAGRGVRFDLTIIGDGEERPKLEVMVQELGLSGRVRFTGALPPEDIAAELNRHRFLVVPSRCEEGFGIVALEGLACGCVPIVSRRGGLPEAIGRHGYTFENGDVADLARVLGHVLAHPGKARAKLDGVEQHLARHTARRVAAEYIRFFEKVLARA